MASISAGRVVISHCCPPPWAFLCLFTHRSGFAGSCPMALERCYIPSFVCWSSSAMPFALWMCNSPIRLILATCRMLSTLHSVISWWISVISMACCFTSTSNMASPDSGIRSQGPPVGRSVGASILVRHGAPGCPSYVHQTYPAFAPFLSVASFLCSCIRFLCSRAMYFLPLALLARSRYASIVIAFNL